MTEADAQSRFTKFIRESGFNQSCAWELKFSKGSAPIAFSSFQPQQIPSLMKAKHGCIYKKLSDADPSLKPFDAFQICFSKAFVVLVWWQPRAGITAYWIDVEDFVLLMQCSEGLTKSVSEFLASKVATYITKI